ncbi:hypothetical protein [Haloferula sp. BvORR071]|uniref:hypothetical protein n=1 Tax=Haloferula sp. BvORR071 TaxID=1396141 RepID=UPI000698E53B|nr:hypothetical protein [Haloferula sp. BvORR071]
MIYRLECSSGNIHGLDEYVSYSEIGADGYWLRYLEFRADGSALRYTTQHPADHLGILPEGVWDEVEASKAEYGTVTPISRALFESVWSASHCMNDKPPH